MARALVVQDDPDERMPPEVDIDGDEPLRILLAEDDPLSQKVAQLVLTRLGHHVDAVSDGFEAVAAVRRSTYDLVLMDVQMPGLDGLAAARRIRDELPGGDRIAVVAVTASNLVEHQEACARAGMDACIAKPLRAQAVRELLVGLRGRAADPA